MMPDNGTGHGGHYTPAEAERLAREKAELAEQVMMLKQQLQGSVSYSGNSGSYAGTSYAGNSASYSQGFRDDRSVGSMGSRGHRSIGNGYTHQGGYPQGGYPQGGYAPGPPIYPAEMAVPYHGYPGPVRDGEAALYDEYRQGLSVAPTNEGAMDDISVDSYEDRSVRSSRSNRSGRSTGSKSVHSIRSARSARSAASKNSHRSRRAKNGFEPPLQDYKRPESPPGSQAWRSLAFICTFMIPDVCVPKEGAGPKQAWREKVTICMIAILMSAITVGGIGFLPLYFCQESYKFTQSEIWRQSGSAWITIYGQIYDMAGYIHRHPGGQDGILRFLGNDASRLFPRVPPARLPAFCLNTTKNEYLTTHDTTTCTQLTEVDLLTGVPCHDQIVGIDGVKEQFKNDLAGELVIPQWELGQNGMQYIRIKNTIYNVTQYVSDLWDNRTNTISDSLDHPNAYLFGSLHRLIMIQLNKDATQVYYDLFDTDDYLYCLDQLFFEATVDDRYDPACNSIGVLMYFFLFFITGMLAVQVLCSFLYLCRRHRQFTEDDLQAAVMVMVPCYNEGDGELRKTLDSVINTSYPEENKLVCVVADGVITGNGEKYSTPEICARILGFEMDENDETHHYRSLGRRRDNYASVYAGTYEKEVQEVEISLKYVVVVKRGAPEEQSSGRPGNRGKRDSQLVLAGMFNRIHYNREPSELDMALVKALFSLGMPAKDIEYLMTIDADTRVHVDSMSHMVYSMEQDKKILACCGETQVDNKAQSWVTMIQVFEYYSSHHLKKAFESVFGCVTCLPGCFTMYRVMTEDMKCLIAHDLVYIDYARNDIPSLHEKNLFELGEDRMLTTLLLQYFPGMRLSFVPEAMCWTIVPHTMWILLSQRRRWINSTFHNMYELLKVQTMCGICMFSMKMVVIMDLIVTMILPASLVYIGYLIYLFITQPELIDTFVLIFYGVSFSLQMLSFLVRSRWDYLWWFAVFCVGGIPVFYFILPIYAFANMDDFSWGKTRTVTPATEKVGDVSQSEESDSEEDSDAESTSSSDEDGTGSRKSAGPPIAMGYSGMPYGVPGAVAGAGFGPGQIYGTGGAYNDNASYVGPLPVSRGPDRYNDADSYAGASLGASTIATRMTNIPPSGPNPVSIPRNMQMRGHGESVASGKLSTKEDVKAYKAFL